MATPPASWFPWRRYQRAIGVWAARALGFDPAGREVLWADYNQQRPTLPYLALQLTSGPTRRAQDAERWPQPYATTVRVTILPAAVAATGDLANLFVNGELFTHTAVLADTVTTVRNDLVAQINASVGLDVVAAPVGANAFDLTAPDKLGGLRVNAALACTAETIASALVAMTIGAREIRIRATAYGAPEPGVADDAVSVAEWIELITQATQDPDLRLWLRRQGLVCTRVAIIQQRESAVSGAEREPRAAADLFFNCEVRRGRAVDIWLDEVVALPPEDPTAIDPP